MICVNESITASRPRRRRKSGGFSHGYDPFKAGTSGMISSENAVPMTGKKMELQLPVNRRVQKDGERRKSIPPK